MAEASAAESFIVRNARRRAEASASAGAAAAAANEETPGQKRRSSAPVATEELVHPAGAATAGANASASAGAAAAGANEKPSGRKRRVAVRAKEPVHPAGAATAGANASASPGAAAATADKAPPEIHPADGGCFALAGAVIKVWKSVEAGQKLLDDATTEWITSPDSTLRDDYKQARFLGVPGNTWAYEIMKRVVISQHCDYRLVKFVEAKDGMPTKLEYVGKDAPPGVVSIDDSTRLIIDGVVNPSYTDHRNKSTVHLFTKENAKDTPVQNRSNWQHGARRSICAHLHIATHH